VRENWQAVQQARDAMLIHQFAPITRQLLVDTVAPLMSAVDVRGEGEALRWDLLLGKAQAAAIADPGKPNLHRAEILEWVGRLPPHLNPVRAKADELKALRSDAFWQSLQDRVYREVSVRREEPASSFRTALQHLFAPRWTWAASTALVLLTAAVLLFRPAHQTTPVTTAAGDQPAYGAQIASDNDDMDVTVLGTHELRTLSAWADSELAAITSDNTLVATTGSAMDIDDELAGLTAGQLQRLSKMLEAKKQEGRT